MEQKYNIRITSHTTFFSRLIYPRFHAEIVFTSNKDFEIVNISWENNFNDSLKIQEILLDAEDFLKENLI